MQNTKNLPPALPLAGIKIIELAGIGPGPYAGQILADLGANVVRVERPNSLKLPIENRSKTIIELDLQTDNARKKAIEMVKTADVIFEGNRPGVAERLGLGPKDCQSVNPKLVYGRMTGWGQNGPWANKAGHDINYIGLTGALHAMGERGEPPKPPINFVGDYGGGSQFLVIGILAALLEAKNTGKGRIIDAAIIDGTTSMLGILYSLDSLKLWDETRGAHLLDGSRPSYRCYKTSDQKFMAVGCFEPKFYAQMLELLGLDLEEFGDQNTPALWPKQNVILEHIFAAQPRAHWETLFETSDACVTPVLTYKEAPNHAHNKARKSHITTGDLLQPSPAPRFDS